MVIMMMMIIGIVYRRVWMDIIDDAGCILQRGYLPNYRSNVVYGDASNI